MWLAATFWLCPRQTLLQSSSMTATFARIERYHHEILANQTRVVWQEKKLLNGTICSLVTLQQVVDDAPICQKTGRTCFIGDFESEKESPPNVPELVCRSQELFELKTSNELHTTKAVVIHTSQTIISILFFCLQLLLVIIGLLLFYNPKTSMTSSYIYIL